MAIKGLRIISNTLIKLHPDASSYNSIGQIEDELEL